MEAIIAFLSSVQPQHWLVFGLVLLIAEMASGTTYLLWPAVAAFITALISYLHLGNWASDIALFAVLTIVLTAYGRPLVQRFRAADSGMRINERAAQMVGTRGTLTAFADGVGSIKINDSIWRAVSDEALQPGQHVEIAAVEGTTVKVRAVG
jgi:membrane protein implicated in regulation of membrane protease activity